MYMYTFMHHNAYMTFKHTVCNIITNLRHLFFNHVHYYCTCMSVGEYSLYMHTFIICRYNLCTCRANWWLQVHCTCTLYYMNVQKNNTQKHDVDVITMNGVWCPSASSLSPSPWRMLTKPATPAYLPNATNLTPLSSRIFS